FIANNGVNALLVGGLNMPLSCTSAPDGCVIASTQSPITVADSNAEGQLSGWRAFGAGLPNALIEELAYNPTVDVLTAGLVGRGAWVLYDATSLFPQATILKFGLANNNSTPDAALLTNGTVGSRPLIKYGTGTLTIAGNASYTGSTTIDDGTLQLGAGGASGSILGNVTFCTSAADPLCNATESKFLVVDRSDAYTFGGLIAGPGQLVQAGSGTLILTGNSGGFLGPTLAAGGALVIGPGAKLGGSVTVENHALVGGYGTIGGALANPSGIVMPGGSIGTLSVGGNYVQGSGGALLTLLGRGAASVLAVGGKASLAGTLDLAAAPGAGPAPFGKMVILTAGRGVIGTFGQVMDLSILPASVLYTASAVDVQLGGFAGGTGNTAAIVTALNAAVPTATGDFAAALGLALTLPAAQLQQTLASFGGPIYGNMAQVSLADRRLFLSAMDRRIGLLSGDAPAGANEGGRGGGIPGGIPGGVASLWGRGGNAMQLATLGEAIDDPNGAAAGEPGTAAAPPCNLWARGFGQFGSIGNSGVAPGSNYSTGGGTIGADLIRDPDSLFGVAVGGGQSSLSVNTLPESGTIGFVQLGAYGAHALGRGFAIDGAGILAHDFYDVSRSIVLPGAPRAATSSHGGNDVVADVGFSRPFLADDWQVMPRAGLAYFHIGQSAFSEAGAGGVDLAVAPNPLDAMFSRVGVTIARPMASGDTELRSEIRLAWTHNFLDTADRFGASFIGAGAAGFGQVGPAVGRDAAELGVGLSFAIAQDAVPGRMSGFVHYDATLASHETANTFAAGLRLNW
ncbi:MAG TPA: autotransporter domain-containing protein, partial [Stellaceae bacterium]|nr:autotransporter domain-containing protein [Stellaceae bacterium]